MIRGSFIYVNTWEQDFQTQISFYGMLKVILMSNKFI